MYSYAPLGSPSSEKASRPCSLVLVQKPKPCSLPLAAQQSGLDSLLALWAKIRCSRLHLTALCRKAEPWQRAAEHVSLDTKKSECLFLAMPEGSQSR